MIFYVENIISHFSTVSNKKQRKTILLTKFICFCYKVKYYVNRKIMFYLSKNTPANKLLNKLITGDKNI